MSRKGRIRPMKIRKVSRNCDIPHIYSSLGGIKKVPLAAYEGCVLVPFRLASFIPESAIRKFAANEAFAVNINAFGEERLGFYCGKHDKPPRKFESYQIREGAKYIIPVCFG
jgi:hypothetical protein